MIRLYEKKGIKVDKELTVQYLQNTEVAKSFALYYDLFNKYKSDYQVDRILAGSAGEGIVKRATEAPFDERLSLLSLLLSALEEKFAGIAADECVMDELLTCAKSIRLKSGESDPLKAMDDEIEDRKKQIEAGKKAGRLSKEDRKVQSRTVAALEDIRGNAGDDLAAAFREYLLAGRDALKAAASETGAALENCFAFCEEAFGDDHEMLILISELTAGRHSAHFISRYGSEGYYRHNEALSFNERQQAIQRELEQFDELDAYYL